MPGMWMSASSRSGAVSAHIASAVSPSPDASTGPASGHFASRADRRTRANGSSSTIRMRMNPPGQAQAYLEIARSGLDAQLRLPAEMVLQALAHAVQAMAVAARCPGRRQWVADVDVECLRVRMTVQTNHAAVGKRLDAMHDRVFHQGLQQQARQRRVQRQAVQMTFHAQAPAQAQLLDGQVAIDQGQLLAQRALALAAERRAEQFGQ